MKIAITGSEGKVAQALINQLNTSEFEVTGLDITGGHDSSDYSDLVQATKAHDALVHMAWKDINTETVDPLNRVMYENAYKAAVANNIGLVIMGSSNHARSHEQTEPDGKIRYTGRYDERANNPYGKEKQRMESTGLHYARKYGLRVLALRIGNVNEQNKPKSDVPTRWLSYRDLGQLVSRALHADFPEGHFEVVYGVSKQPLFDWQSSFGYEPIDEAQAS